MNFNVVVEREKFISRILIPISKISSKAVLILEGNRIFAMANLTNSANGQMFMLSDIPMQNSIAEKTSMVLGNVSKMIIALKAVDSKIISILYDGSGLEYKSNTISFRIRLSTETIKIPFDKDKIFKLKINGTFCISDSELREFCSVLSGFPNLNQLELVSDGNRVVFNSIDRDGVSGENLRFSAGDNLVGSIPEGFCIYNYIFRSSGLSSMGGVYVKVGDAFCMICVKNGSESDGEIRYILPKLKMKA